jgi:leader peptidase (prepilin peptidase)/N-methyltransferase
MDETIGMTAVAWIFGAVIGSFLNVVIHRLPRGESLAQPGSHCPSCQTPVSPRDNVPLLSWVLLRGRCRHCRTPISARYPGIELVTAVAFGAVVAVRGFDDGLLLELPFVAILIAVAGIDLEHRIVPNRITLPAAVWAIAAWAVVEPAALPEVLIAGAATFALMLVVALAYPAGMGMGDVKLAGVIGLYLGAAVIPAVFAAFLAGSLVGIAIIAREGRSGRKRGVPFAPFLALGGLLGVLAGDELIALYSDRFLG